MIPLEDLIKQRVPNYNSYSCSFSLETFIQEIGSFHVGVNGFSHTLCHKLDEHDIT